MKVRLGLALLSLAAAAPGLEPEVLWRAWPQERFVTTPAPCLRPAELGEWLDRLATRHPELSVREVGRSLEGRPIHLVTLGSGETKVLLWSQMHGDEPSATPALLDFADYLLRHRDDPDAAAILDRLTLLLVPMLNPDGAEVYTRRNAQGIDVNRDALNLTTPEGRLLKRLRDEHEPVLGFNLHDQDRRRSVADTGVLATIALLAVAGDAQRTVTPGRLLAMRACSAIAEAVAPYVPGGLARWDDAWSPRSFGDAITAWGTPVVLIESGGVPPGGSLEELTRLNFVAYGAALAGLARHGLASHDPALYDAIPENNVDAWSDVAVRGGEVLQPGAGGAYRADVAFDVRRSDRERTECPGHRPAGPPRSEITELGDARVFGAGREIDGRGRLILAPFAVGVRGWSARRWLDGAALDGLGRLGVARVSWVVRSRHVGDAMRLASSLAAAGRPRLEVGSDEDRLPPRVLVRPPRPPEGATLAGRVESLERAFTGKRSADLDGALKMLWGAGRLPLRYEAPASFTLLRRVEGTGLADAVVEATWLDGVELEGGPR
ncbi:MAG: M14 family zinc carboxypeptidase [Acidobacteriota bacterium]